MTFELEAEINGRNGAALHLELSLPEADTITVILSIELRISLSWTILNVHFPGMIGITQNSMERKAVPTHFLLI